MQQVTQPKSTLHQAAKVRKRWLSAELTVLIVTDNPGASHNIVSDLRKIGLDVKIAHYDGGKLASIPQTPPSAILCFFTDYLEKTPAVCRVLRKHYAPKNLPIIGAMMRPSSIAIDHFDTVIFGPIHSSQIANRVDAMIRIHHMESEIGRRVETFTEDFRINISTTGQYVDRPIRILFIGKATPAFMVIFNALQNENVEVVAAFTSFSAFDYLHEKTFDAVVINAVSGPEPALTIAETMRRNSQFYHVPVIFLTDSDRFQHTNKAVAQGVRDLITVNTDPDQIRGRIVELANYHRIHQQLKLSFSNFDNSECIDGETGLFNEAFFGAHIKRLCRDTARTEHDLTLLAIHPTVKGSTVIDPAYLNMALIKIGMMLKNLVRMQDIVARVETDIFLLAFPNTSKSLVEKILERINGLADCAAFETGLADPNSFTFTLNTAITQYCNESDSKVLISQTIAELSAAIAKSPQFSVQ